MFRDYLNMLETIFLKKKFAYYFDMSGDCLYMLSDDFDMCKDYLNMLETI